MSKSTKNQVGAGNAEQSGAKIPQKPSKKGKTPKQLMTRQVHDEKAVITDEEFKEVNLDITADADTAHEPLVIRDDQDRPKDEGKDHPVVTPWDVLKE